MTFWNKQDKPAPEKPAASQAGAAPLPPIREKEDWNPMAMSRREEQTTPVASGNEDLLLGHGAEFEGKLTFAGTVRIDAKFKGSISTNDVLVVGEHARIDADITCGTVVIYGEVNGNIKAKTGVELHHPARMRGNIETSSLMIEKGVLFQGEAKMEGVEKSAPVKAVPSFAAASSGAASAGLDGR
jgi:cytoskeletal protein CcmA (bactofilin family)